MSAGYSKRSLAEKLGIKPGMTVAVLGAAPDYRTLLAPLPPDVTLTDRLPAKPSFIHQFVRRRAELERAFPRVSHLLTDGGALWISWPKKAAKVATDLTENVVREVGLESGLVDVKVCAVDEVWSGLKFVRRVADRKQ
jgi:hypothetical protein